ncbi:DUF881 domain-containing protein [Blastococcus sp. MG754426]|uniref:DUF881 domain-containing protein n=1 Tax=unclassified Blastococcus TaxID=2619396 RepID=UPI001EF12661|nr:MULTISPECIES: DUF881 domain-containing protein [unclassified Blastococcus]MCF6508153.1 DUF881 domain-containing protein [Blastococcus sp. MG754426]MCF6512238.1 DUF881 domain-containing protein [Blastococcus sp. MG754427]MCF6735817.1 DUF881 domain-containing protein [Blastococcus sp. KM273129]
MARWSLPGRSASAWGALVPVVALAAGLLFATSGRTAQGSDLRAGEVTQLSQLVEERDAAVVRQERQLVQLQAQVQRLTDQVATRDGDVAQEQAVAEAGAPSAGLTPVTGAGVVITLDDAPQRSDGSLPRGARPDDLVIHQSDVQAVVNAVWAAGAEGVAVMDQRLISTSAVRCVGNTLLLQGRTYSPPFVVTAVVDASRVEAALDASPQVAVFEQAVASWGLTFEVRERPQVTVPAYDGGLTLQHAAAG